MTKNPRLLLPALVLALGLSMAACGSDDKTDDAGPGDSTSAPDTSDTPDAPEETEDTPDVPDVPDVPEGITKDAFIAAGNQICEAGNQAIEAAGQAIDQTDPEQIVPFLTTVLVPAVRAQIESLKALGYPEGDEDTLNAIYDDTEAALQAIEDDPEAAFAGPDPFADINQALSDYGLTTCAS